MNEIKLKEVRRSIRKELTKFCEILERLPGRGMFSVIKIEGARERRWRAGKKQALWKSLVHRRPFSLG